MKVLINSRTGERGDYADWVGRFEELWSGGRSRVGDFMTLFGDEVKLTAPGLRTTYGPHACEQAFVKTFQVMPDLTATVHRWGASDDVLFIEMTFAATVGGKRTEWRNVDRLLFHNGIAFERQAFFNPLKVRRAFLANPRGWRQLLKRIRLGL